MDGKTPLEAVREALSAWDSAPPHIRLMAGAYVRPMLAALVILATSCQESNERITRIEGTP